MTVYLSKPSPNSYILNLGEAPHPPDTWLTPITLHTNGSRWLS